MIVGQPTQLEPWAGQHGANGILRFHEKFKLRVISLETMTS